jgi:FtsH-binding integral membrane protein
MNNIWKQNVAGAQTAAYDQGLRSYMLNIYNYMAGGLAITGVVALFVAQTEALLRLFYSVNEAGQMTGMTPLGWIAAFAPIGFVLFLSFKIQSMSFKTAQLTFWVFAGVMGISLSNLFLLYTGASIARVFFITAGLFGGMSLYGYTTKRDLTGMGSFLIMGVWGLLIASLVNIFMQSSMMQFAISVLSVLIFTGLTAYDTQKIKGMYYALAGTGEMAAKMAIMGALNLYMDFINIFIHLMRLMGERR